jgi:hypothetical protein
MELGVIAPESYECVSEMWYVIASRVRAEASESIVKGLLKEAQDLREMIVPIAPAKGAPTRT